MLYLVIDRRNEMNHSHSSDRALTASIEFWTRLWQQQIEQGMKFWGLWAQALPHETARDLSAEAESHKAPKA